MPRRRLAGAACLLLAAWPWHPARTAEQPVVAASYNVENWLSMDRFIDGRKVPGQPKPESEKQAVIDVLSAIKPDILGIVEIGRRKDLDDLASRLKQAGLDYPHREWVEGGDPARHVALLSRHPIVARNSRSDIRVSLNGRLYPIERGILDVTIEPAPGYRLRLLGAHLKSKRAVPDYDEAAMRAKEAWALRQYIDGILEKDPKANLLLFGDLNDTKNEYPIREILGQPHGAQRLTDLLLTDRNGERWTHFWKTADIYSRIDYFIASPGLLPEIIRSRSGINQSKNWHTASDHRAIFTAITPRDR